MKMNIILQHLGVIKKKGKPPLDGLPLNLSTYTDDGKSATIIGNHLISNEPVSVRKRPHIRVLAILIRTIARSRAA